MPWVTKTAKEVAETLGVDYEEVKAKQELIDKIYKAREKHGLTQQDLADMIGKSQGYVARIERGVGTKNISFDVLLRILNKLGYRYKINTRKQSDPDILAA